MEFEEGLKLICDGRALLFIGAGFSRGATNLLDADFALGSDLNKVLSDEAGLPTGLDLDDAAELYVAKMSISALVNKVKESFTARTVADSHKEIASAPWKRIYTTNYDDVFELASSQVSRRVDSVVPSDDVAHFSKRYLLCVHLNGLVRRTTNDSIWKELKLTQGSYDSGSALDSDWGRLFRSDLQAAQAIFFVGYSLTDIDVRRLLFEEGLIDKTFFVLGPSPSAGDMHRAVRFGLPVAKGADEFAQQLAGYRSSYTPDDNPTPLGFCLSTYQASVSSITLEDRQIFDLLLWGRLKHDLVSASLQGSVNYVGQSQAVLEAVSLIERGLRVVALHSSLGNGKTVALEELKYLLFAKGYKVVTVINRGDSFADELQSMLTSEGRKVFFIDNYIEWLDTFAVFGTHRSEDFSLVISARSSSHDVLIDRVTESLGISDFAEISLDSLSLEDLQWVGAHFDEFGIWGDKASWSDQRKTDYLLRTCGGEWQGILIKLLESPHIIDKLQVLYSAFRTKGVYREPVICLLILSVLAYSPSSPTLIDLCGDRILESGFRKDEVVRELIDFGRSSVGMHSSVTAEVLLRQVADPNITVSALVGMIQRADAIAASSAYNEDLFKSLVRYSTLHLMFPESERGRAGMRVYEAVKDLPRCRRSPLFWLQYAIAALVAHSFERAKTYFENAYSFAKQMYAYDSYQIDNHYARFLLERAVHLQDHANAMHTFREARGLIFPQLVGERRHYPYRVATRWEPFYATFGEHLAPADQLEVKRAAEYVVKRIAALPADRAAHRSVVECSNAMQKLIEEISAGETKAT